MEGIHTEVKVHGCEGRRGRRNGRGKGANVCEGIVVCLFLPSLNPLLSRNFSVIVGFLHSVNESAEKLYFTVASLILECMHIQ